MAAMAATAAMALDRIKAGRKGSRGSAALWDGPASSSKDLRAMTITLCWRKHATADYFPVAVRVHHVAHKKTCFCDECPFEACFHQLHEERGHKIAALGLSQAARMHPEMQTSTRLRFQMQCLRMLEK